MESEVTVEEAEKAATVASLALETIERMIEGEVAEAKAAIVAKHHDTLRAARDRVMEAKAALVAARDKTPDHPWTGRAVYRLKRQGYSWESRAPLRVEGVVETFRSTSEIPENTSRWGRPAIGQPIVRLLKKDGSPGAKFVILRDIDGWKLADEPTP